MISRPHCPRPFRSAAASQPGSPAVAHYYGGGDLLVQAEGSIYSSAFYVGEALDGSCPVAMSSPIRSIPSPASQRRFSPTPSQAAFCQGWISHRRQRCHCCSRWQDGFISVQASGDVTLGGIFEPTRIPADSSRIDSALPTASGSLRQLRAEQRCRAHQPHRQCRRRRFAAQPQRRRHHRCAFTKVLESVATASRNNLGINTGDPGRECDQRQHRHRQQPLCHSSANGSITLARAATFYRRPQFIRELDQRQRHDARRHGVSTLAANVPLYDILGAPTPAALTSAVHADDADPVILYAGLDIIGAA